MNTIKEENKSIVVVGNNNMIDTWISNGGCSPVNNYEDGWFVNSPMNIEDFDFVSIFFGEQ